jgi:hypothetical protein
MRVLRFLVCHFTICVAPLYATWCWRGYLPSGNENQKQQDTKHFDRYHIVSQSDITKFIKLEVEQHRVNALAAQLVSLGRVLGKSDQKMYPVRRFPP